MKVVILHHDLEWSEKELFKVLTNKGISVILKDIRSTSTDKILSEQPDIVLNRVYASVANRDFASIPKTLELLRQLEEKGVLVINNYKASKVDYSKYYAYKKMASAGINTPKTWLVDEIPDNIEYPLVVKRDTGGRGKDLKLVNNIRELKKAVKQIREDSTYTGNIIAQEFVKPIKPFDYRIGLFNYNFLYGNRRTLISDGAKFEWMASISRGSKLLKFDTSEKDIIEFAIKASKAVGAIFNVLDISISEKGLTVIENNPTPNYGKHWSNRDDLGFNPLEIIADGLINRIKLAVA